MSAVTQKILPLTSLRFFAALYVVLFHTLSEFHVADKPLLYRNLLGLGYISVSFFFVLSGYILSIVYLKNGHAPRAKRFWIARFARVYPLFLLTLLLDTPLFFLGHARRLGYHASLILTSKVLLANCLLIQAWKVSLRGIDNPNWSLSVEAFFYLLFPLMALVLAPRASKTLIMLLVVSYVGGLTMVITVSGLHLPEQSLKFSPVLHLHEFIMGVCAGLLISRIGNKQSLRLHKASSYLFCSAAIMFIGFILIAHHVPYLLVHDGLLSPLYVIVIISVSSGPGLINRVLSHRWLVLLGEASYALYLLHFPLWGFAKHSPLGHRLVTYPLYLTVTIGISIASFYLVEGPSRRGILSCMEVRNTSGKALRPEPVPLEAAFVADGVN
jgi:peptidoglycan/LPS O-acetylase OafA/YrhL